MKGGHKYYVLAVVILLAVTAQARKRPKPAAPADEPLPALTYPHTGHVVFVPPHDYRPDRRYTVVLSNGNSFTWDCSVAVEVTCIQAPEGFFALELDDGRILRRVEPLLAHWNADNPINEILATHHVGSCPLEEKTDDCYPPFNYRTASVDADGFASVVTPLDDYLYFHPRIVRETPYLMDGRRADEIVCLSALYRVRAREVRSDVCFPLQEVGKESGGGK